MRAASPLRRPLPAHHGERGQQDQAGHRGGAGTRLQVIKSLIKDIQSKCLQFRCTDGEYTRDQVQESRGQFPWKVVEPFDGAAAMDWVSWDSVGMADRVEWKHKVVIILFS